MKRNLIALAVAGVIAAPSAIAEVEVYGKIHMSTGYVDNGGDDGDALKMLANNSNIGFRGTEDLGGGLSLVYQAENSLDWSGDKGKNNGKGGWGKARDTYVGFAGDWGWLAIGRHNSPYKNSTGRIDAAGNNAEDYNNIMGTNAIKVIDSIDANGNAIFEISTRKHDDRISNAIMYKSKDMSGFSFQGIWGLDDAQTINSDRSINRFAGSATYASGPIFLTAAGAYYLEDGVKNKAAVGNNDAEYDDDLAWKVAAGYGFNSNNTWIYAMYEQLDAGTDTGPNDNGVNTRDLARAGYYVSVKHKWGANSIGFGYAFADEYDDLDDTDATQWHMQFNHAMSKRTTVYVQGALLQASKFTSGYALSKEAVVADEDAYWVGLGILHKFSSK